MKAFITEYTKYCTFCGTPTNTLHHLCYGGANRKLSDDYGLVIPLCQKCHEEVHHNGTAGRMSKIIGQLAYELNENVSKTEIQESREKFRKTFGMSFL